MAEKPPKGSLAALRLLALEQFVLARHRQLAPAPGASRWPWRRRRAGSRQRPAVACAAAICAGSAAHSAASRSPGSRVSSASKYSVIAVSPLLQRLLQRGAEVAHRRAAGQRCASATAGWRGWAAARSPPPACAPSTRTRAMARPRRSNTPSRSARPSSRSSRFRRCSASSGLKGGGAKPLLVGHGGVRPASACGACSS